MTGNIVPTALNELPLSVNQEALWLTWQLDPNAYMNVIVTPFRVVGALDTDRLRRAVDAVGERFPTLRGTVGPGADSMVLSWAGRPRLGLHERSVENTVDEVLHAVTRTAVDLEHGPLTRVELVHTADGDLLLMTISHLVFDGVSMPNLADTLRTGYRGGSAEPRSDLMDVAAFHDRQHALANGPEGVKHREFWRQYLGADVIPITLPRTPDRSGAFEMLTVGIPPSLLDRIRGVATDLAMTPTVVLYTAYLALLRLWTGQDDLVVSLPTHGRRNQALAGAVGFFSNAIPLRQQIAGGDSYAAVAGRLAADVRRCLRFADLPAPAILRAAGWHGAVGDAARRTIFQYWSALSRDDVDLNHLVLDERCTLELLPTPDVADFDLQVMLREDSDGLTSLWKDVRGTIGRETLESLADDYLLILEAMAADPARPIGDPLPPEQAERRLVARGHRLLRQVRSKRPEPMAASPHQERMGFIDRFETGVVYDHAPVYHNLPYVLRLDAVPSRAGLTAAFTSAVAAHTALRTNLVFTEDGFRQVVRPPGPVEVTWLATGTPDRLRAWIDTPFDLAGDLLIRVGVQPAADGSALLVLVGHQAIVDRASLRLVAAMLRSGAAQERLGYADWLRLADGRGRDRTARDLAAAVARVSEPVDPLRLPERRRRSAVHVYHEAAVEIALPELGAPAARAGTDPQAFLLAAFGALLSWYTGQDEIMIGTTQAARDDAVADVVGPLSNLVPVRLATGVDVPFAELVAAAGAELSTAARHAAAPFDEVVRLSGVGKDMSRTALFDVLFTDLGAEDDGLTASEALIGSGAGKYDLHLAVRPTAGGHHQCRLVFNELYFDADQMAALGTHLARLVEQAGAEPDRPLGEFDPLTSAEQHRQIAEWNDTDTGFQDVSVTELVRRRVAAAPDEVALSAGTAAVTYRELLDGAERTARALVAAGVRPGQLVGLHLARGAEQVRAMLAIQLAGAGYLPLDLAMPTARKQFVLADARIDLLMTGTPGAPDELATDIVEVVTLDGLDPRADPATPLPTVRPEHPAYCIYTSGTTGQPKGVVITHRQLARLLTNDAFPFPFGPGDVWTQFHSYHFDFSVWETFCCLVHGGRLVVVDEEETRDTERFLQLLRRERVTVLNQTPSAFYQLAELSGATELPDLRFVIFGGEGLDAARLRDWSGAHRDVALVNMYGITEVTVHATVHTLTAADFAEGRAPAGVPIPTTSLYVLDPRTGRRLLPQGAVGEVYVGGLGVAAGYLRRPALTAERFVDNPIGPGRLFRSGDLGRLLPDGMLEVLGRSDSQVKLRGHRIELAEIESCLRRHPVVSQAVAQYRDDDTGGRLIAYVEVRDAAVGADEIRSHLGTQLPGYMVPTEVLPVSQIPLTRNGKVDKQAVAGLLVAPPVEAADRSPAGSTAEAVAEVWAGLLAANAPCANDSFFDLGGHSLQAASLMATLSERFGTPLPLRLIFEQPRLQDLADTIDTLTGTAAESPPRIAVEEPTGDTPASSFQQRIFLAERVDPQAHRYAVPLLWRVEGELDLGQLRAALTAVVQRHEILRTAFELRDGELRQVVGPGWEPDVREEDVTDVDRWLQAELEEPFDPASGRLLRCALLRRGAERVLAVLVHHLVWDMRSGPVLLADLARCYTGAAGAFGGPRPGQYRDVVATQLCRRGGPAETAELEYWDVMLRGAPAYMPLPPPGIPDPSGTVQAPLPADLAQRLADLQTRYGVSWFMAATAAFLGALHRFTGAEDLAVGLTVDGRDAASPEDLIGPCLNTVVLRSRHEDGSVGELLTRVREAVLGALEHRTVPFETVVDRLNPPRRVGRTPYADVMVNMDVAGTRRVALGAARLEPFVTDTQRSHDTKFAVTLTIGEFDGALTAVLGYRGDRVERAAAEQIGALFARLLEALPDVLDTPLATVDLLDGAELDRVLALEPGRPADPPDSVPAMIARRIRDCPDAPAVRTASRTLDYRQLDHATEALAHRLRVASRPGEGPRVVAVLLDRGEQLVVGQLAAWRAGFAFCPVDPAYPTERIAFVLADLDAAVALTDQPRLAELARRAGVPVVEPDCAKEPSSKAPPFLPMPSPDPNSPACVLYTSGTTGKPKGSVWLHRGLAQLVRWHVETFDVTADDRASLLASVGFDGAQWELWPYLAAGACVLPFQHPIAVPHIVEWLNENAVTMCFMPTPLAEVMVGGRHQPRTLRWLNIGGATFGAQLPPNVGYRVCNAYGPSENTVVGSVLLLDTANELPIDVVGQPITGTSVSVRDPAGHRCPVGVPGEIYLGGVAVADGYWRRPELTAERFLPGPWYRTGDRGRWTTDGQLQFLGRVDRQLKIHGYRVEPQEIEVALRRDPLVERALVLGFPDAVPALVGYLVPAASDLDGCAADRAVDAASVARRLAEQLPGFMVPEALVWLDELPWSVNGKIDPSALPRPTRADMVRSTRAAASPGTRLERTVSGVWHDVLGLDGIGIDDSFFDVGGNSLLLSTLHARLEAVLMRPLPIHRLFEFPTIRRLASWLSAGGSSPASPAAPDPIAERARRSRSVRAGARR